MSKPIIAVYMRLAAFVGGLVVGCIEADFCKQLLVGIRKALDEINKIYILLHRSDLKTSATIRPCFVLLYQSDLFQLFLFSASIATFIFNVDMFCLNVTNIF